MILIHNFRIPALRSVSTGMGACMAAGVYEVGRPRRLNVEEAQKLEGQWQDFGGCSSSGSAGVPGCRLPQA